VRRFRPGMLAAVALGACALGVSSAVAQTAETAPSAAPPAGEAQAASAVADPRDVVGAPRARPLAGTILDSRTEDVGGLLRCPVCQGLSVADSPSTMAQNMKGHVREMLAAGYDQDQVLTYFESSYGEFVRLQPPLRGVNWLVWLAPIAALLVGGLVVTRVLRAQRAAAAAEGAAAASDAGPAALPDRDQLPDDPRLAAYVLRVREQVYGWPGGRSPAPTAASTAAAAAPVSQPKPLA